jgi:hypothetical protein
MTNNSLSVVPKQLSRDFTAGGLFEFLGHCCKAVSECTLEPSPFGCNVVAGGFASTAARIGGKVFSCLASLLAALLTLTCFAVSFASAGGGALFSGPALLEVSGFTAAPKGEAAVVAPSGGIVQVPVVVAPNPPPNAP